MGKRTFIVTGKFDGEMSADLLQAVIESKLNYPSEVGLEVRESFNPSVRSLSEIFEEEEVRLIEKHNPCKAGWSQAELEKMDECGTGTCIHEADCNNY